MNEVKAMSLQAQNAAKGTVQGSSDITWGSDDYDLFGDDDGEDSEFSTSGCRKCKSKYGGCSGSCGCGDEFDEVHCSLEDLCDKVCDIQFSQEKQDACLATIKGGLGDNGDKLDQLQIDVTQILEDLTAIIDGGGIGGGPDGGNGGGPLVCIKVGGCCGTCGEDTCCCEPPIEPPIEPPGEIIPDPDPLCLIGGDGVGFGNGDLIELWFSAKTRSCSRDYYLGSPSINWLGDYECGMEGFHGEATNEPPGEVEVSQAAFYVKRNNQIPGLNEATTWLYDTTQVDMVNIELDPTLGLEFEGAQLVDSEGLCLTRPVDSILSNTEDPVPQFVIYVDTCVDYEGDIENGDNIDALKRQTWIIENTQFTNVQVIIRATCEDMAIKRLLNEETIAHSSETICEQCRLQHFDLELVELS